jgi:hypothetical protein
MQSIRPTKRRSTACIKGEAHIPIKKRKSRPPCSVLLMPMTAPSNGTIETKPRALPKKSAKIKSMTAPSNGTIETKPRARPKKSAKIKSMMAPSNGTIKTKPRALPKKSAKIKSIKEIAKPLFAQRSSRDDDHAELASRAQEDLPLEKDDTLSSPLHTMAKAAEMHSRVLAEETPTKYVSRSLECNLHCKTPSKAGFTSIDNAKRTPIDRPAQFFNKHYNKHMAKLVSIGSNDDSGDHPHSESKREMAILQTPHEIDTPQDWSFYTPTSANKVLCFQSPTPPGAKAANFIPSSQNTECASVDLSCLEGCDCGDTMSPIPLSQIPTSHHHYHDGAAGGSCARRVSDASHRHDGMGNNNSHDHSWELFDFCFRSGAYPDGNSYRY